MGRPQIPAIDTANRVQLVRFLNSWLHSFLGDYCKQNSMTDHIERARKLNRQASDDIDHGRLEAAKVALNEAIRLAPDLAAPDTNLGVLHCWEGELDKAIALHLKARHLDPNLPAPHTNLGVVYLARDEIRRAIAAFKTSVATNLENADIAHLQVSRVGAMIGVPLYGVK